MWNYGQTNPIEGAADSAEAMRSRPAVPLIGSLQRTGQAIRAHPFSGMGDHGHRRWFDLIWILYSAFFFIEPIQRNTREYWFQFAGFFGLFVGLYLAIVFTHSRRTAYLSMACLGLLGVSYYPLNASAAGIFIYVIAFAPFITESLAVCISIFIAMSFVLLVEGILFHLNPWSWGFPAIVGLAVGSGNLIAAHRMRANQKLSLAHEEIEQIAKVAERERIARDLHDVLGHTLSVVVLKSELAGKLLRQNPERAQREIAEVEQIARTALAEVREAIRGYRSEGLVAEIDRARATLGAAGVMLECTSTAPKLLPAQETVLSLIVREAVTNIVRHAHASHCRIAIERNAGRTMLLIQDNGRGGIQQEGSGLRGMRERVESLGGILHIVSEEGTRLVIEVPA